MKIDLGKYEEKERNFLKNFKRLDFTTLYTMDNLVIIVILCSGC